MREEVSAVEMIKMQNRIDCEVASIEDGASWCEGEEGYGVVSND